MQAPESEKNYQSPKAKTAVPAAKVPSVAQMFLTRLYIVSAFKLGLRQSKWVTQRWYNQISLLCAKVFEDFGCLNYGYSSEELENSLVLRDDDAKEPYQKQLYHYVLSAAALTAPETLKILEVGSGRGGGISYIARHFKPREAVGLELSPAAVEFCNHKYRDTTNLRFTQGDAESLPFPDNYFDVVINVESSHCYPDMNTFLNEAMRVLKKGGFLSLTDFRYAPRIEEFLQLFQRNDLKIVKKEDITENVVRALDSDDERKLRFIQAANLPKSIRSSMINFAGCKGGVTYNEFKNRERIYYLICGQKQ